MNKFTKKVKSVCIYIIYSLTPISTKDLCFAEICELCVKSDYVTKQYNMKMIKYTVVRKKELSTSHIVYNDFFTKSIYKTKDKILLRMYNGTELIVESLYPLPTLKRFISKKTLIYLFSEYIKQFENFNKIQ